MKQVDEFFEKMEEQFLESDKESFQEIKEDLMEHIAIQLEKGKTEDEIVEALGDPLEIAASFYEDQRLDKAMKAEKDIIAVEDIDRVYKDDQKRKRIKMLKKARTFFDYLLLFVLAALNLYLAAFIISCAIEEHFFAVGPATLFLTSMLGTYFLAKLVKRKPAYGTRYLVGVGVVSFVISSNLMYANHWFFQGSYYHKTFALSAQAFKNVRFMSEYPVEISVVPISAKETPKIEIEGDFQKSDQQGLVQKSKREVTVEIGKNDIFEPLKKMRKVEIIFYIPENTAFETIDFAFGQGTINLAQIHAAEVALSLDEGEVFLSDITAQRIAVTSEEATAKLNKVAADLSIDNAAGKTIIKEGQGVYKINTQTGIIELNDVTSKKTILKNQRGETVIGASHIAQLQATNKEGATLVEQQIGKTKIVNGSGKLVLTDIQGELSIDNRSGSIVVNEQYDIIAKVASESGNIKWIQNEQAALDFQLSSDSGKIADGRKAYDNGKNRVVISTKTGDIRIIEKNVK